MADEKPESASKPTGPSAAPRAADVSLGQCLTETRKARGFTPEQIVAETRIPAHYVHAIESDDYATVSDELYLLPFLRRYATFLGLDPEDAAARFIREVQRAENNPSARIAEPISMVTSTRERKPSRGHPVAIVLLIIALVVLAAALYLRRDTLMSRASDLIGEATATPLASPAPSASNADAAITPQAQSSGIPFKTVITPQSPAAPASSPSAPPPTNENTN
ncbi:MAG: helix-turn-helix domain-containing protein [Candidatus Binataceae bacterium]